MNTLLLQHQMHNDLIQQISSTSQAAALITPEVIQHTAAIAMALDGKVTVYASSSGLDIHINADPDTHPDALQIALEQNLPLIEYIHTWYKDDQYGPRNICLVRNGPVQYLCSSAITRPATEPV
ncbi:hypothetical protein [Aquitalea sp. LB_tupeE]|uniref:hypothetical protein n=1 Tax=Aquitalea sp. LB_tupeE TaxID=2748078 RepID=UPI0015B99E33|nr:hypothetical protein [Aquitalea sp. LB_tupeE]NWK79772.1 hypothetical protein [Aquitalea sp. LB_tupeE]